jgi:hypothetical protein
MSKPSEFHIGVLDLFAVLLPGAIATALLEPSLSAFVVTPLGINLSDELSKWAAFLTCSYFLGHLIFLAGSLVDPIYDRVKDRWKSAKHEAALQSAKRVRSSLMDLQECDGTNTFQWARSVLVVRCPAAADDVHRLEADSKFFRSVLVVSLLAAIVFFARGNSAQGSLALLLLGPSFFRYYERRSKSITQAYIHVVTLNRLESLAAAPKPNAA